MCVLEEPVLMWCRLTRNRLWCSHFHGCCCAHHIHFSPESHFALLQPCPAPSLGLGLQCPSCVGVTLGEWFGGRGCNGIDKLAFAWVFPGLTYHMKADDDPNNRLERGGKEQGGTTSSAE